MHTSMSYACHIELTNKDGQAGKMIHGGGIGVSGAMGATAVPPTGAGTSIDLCGLH